MKPAGLQKTAQVTVLMLIISILMPVLAFASGFKDASYSGSTVTGTVYTDTYKAGVTPVVYAYAPDGTQVGVVDATYKSVTGGVYYDFTVTAGTYSYVNLKFVDPFNVSNVVYKAVYSSTYGNSSNTSGGGCCGGGGVGAFGSENLSANSDGTVSSDSLSSSLNQYNTVTITLNGDFALLPAKALLAYTSGGKTLILKNTNGTYVLPLNVLNLKDLASALSVTTDQLNIKVTIAKASSSASDSVNAAAKALGGSVVANAVDFDLVAVGKDNKTAKIDLKRTYVSRYIPISGTIDSSSTTGVVIDTATNKLSFVPTVFSSTYADLKRNSNSVYSVIKLNKSFSDVSGHWAKSNIDLLANKLVVDGVTDNTFEPERSITRAEFAALVVRSLGLQPLAGSSSFKDVAAGEWYSSTVNAAVYANIIQGYEDGTFKPDATINREELSAMVVRALNYAGVNTTVSSTEQTTLLAKFTDASSIVWADQEVSAAIKAGIIDGLTDDTLGARETATRAQSATMLKRLLSAAKFIN